MSESMCHECAELVRELKALMDATDSVRVRDHIAGLIDLARAVDAKRRDANAALESKRRLKARNSELERRIKVLDAAVRSLREAGRLTDAERESIRGQAHADGYADGLAAGYGEAAAITGTRDRKLGRHSDAELERTYEQGFEDGFAEGHAGSWTSGYVEAVRALESNGWVKEESDDEA